MNKFYFTKSLCLLVVVIVVVVNKTQLAEAVKCDPKELRPCLLAFTMSVEPSSTCCNKVKEHRPCYCGYKKNPKIQPYLKYDATKNIISSCGVSIPAC